MVPYGRSIITTDPVNPSHQSNLPAFSLQQWLANANPSALGTLGPPTLIGPSRLSHNRFEMPPDSTAVSSTHALVHRASPSAVVLPTPRSRNMASYSCAQVFAQGRVMAPGASAAPSLRNPGSLHVALRGEPSSLKRPPSQAVPPIKVARLAALPHIPHAYHHGAQMTAAVHVLAACQHICANEQCVKGQKAGQAAKASGTLVYSLSTHRIVRRWEMCKMVALLPELAIC